MSDDPGRPRAPMLTARVDNLERTFVAGGTDPSDPDARERFGEEHRWLRELRAARDRRYRVLATASGTIAAGVATAAILTLGPMLLRLILAAAATTGIAK